MSPPRTPLWDTLWTHRAQSVSLATEVNGNLVNHLLAVTGVTGKRVLEVGCGTGADSVFFGMQGADAYCLDYSSRALTLVRELAKSASVTARCVQADAYRIPFADATFDVVFHQGFLEHFRDAGALIAEQVRVLKPGGIILADVPQRYSLFTVKKRYRMLRGRWYAGWERSFSIVQLERLFRKAGLVVADRYGYDYYPAILGRLRRLGRSPRIGVLFRQRLGWYEAAWVRFERTRAALYVYQNIGLVARKPREAEPR
ncbi:MAG: class I SAM-dependent methyltransferase [Candidatus Rokuibacteriota bacterium]